MHKRIVTSIAQEAKKLNLWDIFAISIIFWIFILIKNTTQYMYSPIPIDLDQPISLSPEFLPEYTLRTTIRLAIGIIISVVFSVVYALIAAKNESLRKFMISLLDIMQSIPVLGYIALTITGFISLFPDRLLGFELAVIFAAFTCQVWNITYSIYQSITTIPENIKEIHKAFNLNPIQRFLMIELPYAMPPLVWNIMISISNSWFFVVASEAIIEGNHSYYLPGIGSYIAVAIHNKSLISIFYAVIAMVLVIVLCDRFVFRPLLEWSNKFKYENCNSCTMPSWSYKVFNKSRLIKLINFPFKMVYNYLLNLHFFHAKGQETLQQVQVDPSGGLLKKIVWGMVIAAISSYAFYVIIASLYNDINLDDIQHSFYLGLITTIRIIAVMLITVVIWLPISIYIGLNSTLTKIIQPFALIMASFPANLIFPFVVFVIQKYSLNPNIWLSILFILSIQWYLVFNILAGICSIPEDLREVVRTFDIKGYALFKKILLPAILPHFLVGLITAWGSAWNTTIIAEIAEWGDVSMEAVGIGAYVTNASNYGDMSKIILGILVMLFYIELFNRFFWRPLFRYADNMSKLQ